VLTAVVIKIVDMILAESVAVMIAVSVVADVIGCLVVN
jgi:hypothetical protein